MCWIPSCPTCKMVGLSVVNWRSAASLSHDFKHMYMFWQRERNRKDSKCNKHQCYLFWYDNHKGWKILLATTVNGVDDVGWKHPRWFYLAPLRGCAECWRQNRNWSRAFLVNVKSSTLRIKEGVISLPGTIFFAQFCLQFTPRTAQTAVMIAPLAGKHKSNEDELGTQLVRAVFAEKSYPKIFEMWCTNMGRLSCPMHETSWNTSMWFTML